MPAKERKGLYFNGPLGPSQQEAVCGRLCMMEWWIKKRQNISLDEGEFTDMRAFSHHILARLHTMMLRQCYDVSCKHTESNDGRNLITIYTTQKLLV